MSEQKIQTDNKVTSKSENENLSNEELKGVVEALLFATQNPLSVKEIKDITVTEDPKVIRDIIEQIKTECIQSNRSFKLVEIAGGFQFITDSIYARWLRKLYKMTKSDYLTKPSLETLSVIAYKQPVTKAEIEFIRGVSVDGVIKNLMQKGLIRISGRKKVIGAPFLYSSTRLFLQYFGLNSLQDLPQLPEFKESDIEIDDKMLVENEPMPEDEIKRLSESNANEQIGGIQDEAQQNTPEDQQAGSRDSEDTESKG